MNTLPQFKWWMGVVEDRIDPENLGRYRVRILGYHTADKISLPTKDLPWAIPLMPVTSASISGVGINPSLVTGSTVMGFFADGEDEQQPIIMGSLNGIPLQINTDSKIGFSDPFANFPRTGKDVGYNNLAEPDISRLSRGKNAEDHHSLKDKRRTRVTDVPSAVGSKVSSTGEDIAGAEYERTFWEEPHPRFGSTESGQYQQAGKAPTFAAGKTSVYPFNQVRETESGHIFEVDDTPGNGRIHEYHNSGSFYEIQHDGTKVTKVVGDDYEIVIKDKKVVINGSCDVTISGDSKLYVQGNMYQEIDGHVFTTIRGSRITKIEGNDLLEINSGSNTSIKGDSGFRVGGQESRTVVSDSQYSIGGKQNISVTGKSNTNILSNKTEIISGNSTSVIVGDYNSATGGNWNSGASGTQTLAAALGQKFQTPQTQQFLVGTSQLTNVGTSQSMIVGSSQSMTVGSSQSIVAGSRSITSTTSHTGAYGVTGALSGSTVTQGSITLGSHKHTAVQTGGGISGTPTP